jgi:hypothetical protein
MNKFNRILLASGLAATASLVANSPAFAGTTGTVNLSGTVPSTLTITVNPSSSNANLTLTPGAVTNVKIGTITGASTNSANGLKVVASSNWKLTSASSASIYIPITAVGDASGTSATSATVSTETPATGGNITLIATSTSVSGSVSNSSLFIRYNVPSGQAAGTYTGSITFTASDK